MNYIYILIQCFYEKKPKLAGYWIYTSWIALTIVITFYLFIFTIRGNPKLILFTVDLDPVCS